MSRKIQFGVDAARQAPELLRGRVGFVTNDAAKTAIEPRTLSRIALIEAGVQLVRLFTPEHGLQAKSPDGAPVTDCLDALTGLPAISLYGGRMRPSHEALNGLDLMVFDIPTIGARFYTYIWTLWHVLEACAEAGLPLVVLDRPNPIGGNLDAVEGPMLDVDRFGSFLGRSNIPIRYGLTAGELARLWNSEAKLKADVRVVKCEGWGRDQHWPETGLPFERTSPAIASYLSALLYPGTCLFEATNLSVARGTEWSFQAVGAPWLNVEKVAARFNRFELPGLVGRACEIAPGIESVGNVTPGIRLDVVAPKSVRPVSSGLALLGAVIAEHPNEFRWAEYPTAANPSGKGHFERLIGRSGIREALVKDPERVAARIAEWTSAEGWKQRVEPILLYP